MNFLDRHRVQLARGIVRTIDPPDGSMVELYVSDTCSLHCIHCFHAETHSLSAPLSLEEWIANIEAFIDAGIRSFHLSGREPFAASVTIPILHYLHQRKHSVPLQIGVISDGFSWKLSETQLSDELLDYLEFSLDGPAHVNDLVRGVGSYTRTSNGIRAALSIFPCSKLSVATTLLRTNRSYVRQIVEAAKSLGISRHYFQPMRKTGRARQLFDQELSSEEYGFVIEDIREFLSLSKETHQVVVFVPVEMTDRIIENHGWLAGLCKAQLNERPAVISCGKSLLNIDFEVFSLPYWNHLILTHDGYLIPHFSDRESADYVRTAIGNVRSTPPGVLILQGRDFARKCCAMFCAQRDDVDIDGDLK